MFGHCDVVYPTSEDVKSRRPGSAGGVAVEASKE